MLVLSNEDVEKVLTIPRCVEELEKAYRELGERAAVNRPRTDMYVPTGERGIFYIFKSMEGFNPSSGVVALRICSDTIRWYGAEEGLRKEKMPALPGSTWLGLVWLFSAKNGAPLAILQDGIIQKSRVAASSAVAAKYMSRQDSSVLAVLGSGWQAGAHVEAMSVVRPIKLVRVFSPNPSHRSRFANNTERKLNIEAKPCSTADEAVADADIVVCATNCIEKVVAPHWITGGRHFTCVKYNELGYDTVTKADLVVVNTRHWAPDNYIPSLGEAVLSAHDPMEIVGLQRSPEEGADLREPEWENLPTLGDLVAGKTPARNSKEQISCFVNSIGLGVQFAAVAGFVYELARQHGLGREIPTEWFLQRVEISTAPS
jgi:ornithine cyclodeaminase/alanine dehydrogenase-like protein (mu-crystallin family)